MKNTTHHLEKSVIYIFLVVFLLSVSVFAYKYSKYAPCENVNFNTNSNDFTIGSLIKFEDRTEGAMNWQWDFGDNSLESTKKKPLHIYKEPGEYQVRLLVNGTCEQIESITILPKKELLDASKFPVFSIPKKLNVGEELVVTDKTKHAVSWEWRFGETAEANATTKVASYTYKKPGLKTVSLIVNGELKYNSKQQIEIIPLEETVDAIYDIPSKPIKGIKYKPETLIKDEPNSTSKLVPYIRDKDFEDKVMLIAEEKMNPNQLSEYFCNDINKPIIVNGKNTTFLIFCERVKGKSIKIKDLKISRVKGSNCIDIITIDYRRGGLF